MRRKRKFKKLINPDPIYNSLTAEKFINHLMVRGQKATARKIFYGAFEIIKQRTGKDNPLEIFDLAIRNASPMLEVKSRRVGGANYQVPQEVRGERRIALSHRWIIQGARRKKGKPMADRLADELIDASNNQGMAVKKKEDTHRMAEANRAFAHFAR
ncbi:MAG: 30S ribosomal protein S7 [bacterium]|nr:30S ribosomal protein S7 [bacterium]